MSNINFLIADVIQFVSGTITTFSQGNGTKTQSKQLLEFGSQTKAGFPVIAENTRRQFLQLKFSLNN